MTNEETRQARSYVQGNDVSKPMNQVEESLLRKLNSKCAQRDASSCAMLKLVTYMNRLLKKANIDVADNIEITQTSEVVQINGEFRDSAAKRDFPLGSVFFILISVLQPKICREPCLVNPKRPSLPTS